MTEPRLSPPDEADALMAAVPRRSAWAVWFRVATLRQFADDQAIHAMFALPPVDLHEVSHVLLTSEGTLLRTWAGAVRLVDAAVVRPDRASDMAGAPLAAAVRSRLARLAPATADCVGVGKGTDGTPVAMNVHVADSGADTADPGADTAEVWCSGPVSSETGHLLAAVGAGIPTQHDIPGLGTNARFPFDLRIHLEAARLGGYQRTANCTAFYLDQLHVTDPIRTGLARAGADRIGKAYATLLGRAAELAARIDREPVTMTAITGTTSRPFGDVVPAGILLAGLRVLPPGTGLAGPHFAAVSALRSFLLERRHDDGFSFHTGGLTTATDSALVAQGTVDAATVATLERYADGDGGILPQLVGDDHPAAMPASPEVAHWCVADFLTTCLVRSLRRRSGYPDLTPIDWLSEVFETRRSVFCASPWLLDWALALALHGDPTPSAGELRERLLSDIVSSANEDLSFGRRDERLLATAAAVCALDLLGDTRAALLRRTARLRLTEMLDDPAWNAQVPFLSSRLLVVAGQPIPTTGVAGVRAFLGAPGAAPLVVGDEVHELTTYVDGHAAITTGLALMALRDPADDLDEGTHWLLPDPDSPPHPRYRCADVAEYAARFALV